MLREIRNVKQYGAFRRRWFNDEQLDLFVWYDARGQIAGFQLCFDKKTRERALTYSEEKGYSFDEVNANHSAWDMSSPVLVRAREFPRARLLAELGARGAKLDSFLFTYLKEKLEAFPSPPQPGIAQDS